MATTDLLAVGTREPIASGVVASIFDLADDAKGGLTTTASK